MTLLWFDGFEGYGDYLDIDKVENLIQSGNPPILAASGRRSSQCLRTNDNDGYWIDLPSEPSTIIFGVALYLSTGVLPTEFDSINRCIFSLRDSIGAGNVHLYFQITADRTIVVKDSAWAEIGETSGHTIEGTTWYYIEVEATISNTVGQVTIRVDEVERLSTSADKDTLNGSNAYVGNLHIGRAFHIDTYWDDLYVCDDLGSKNNAFLGDVRVDVIRPDGVGAHTEFDPSAGANWENVDDDPGPDDDGTYNDGDLAEQDTYRLADLAALGTTIHGVKSQITARKTDAGSRKVKIITRSNASDYLSSEKELSDSWITFLKVYEDNPDDAAAWEEADVNGAEVGIEVTS